MSAHTPGPWEVCEDGVNVFAPETDTAITNQDHPCAPDHDEACANARLIAAAPDLLSACKAALADLDAALHGRATATNPVQLHQLLRAALASAEGRAP